MLTDKTLFQINTDINWILKVPLLKYIYKKQNICWYSYLTDYYSFSITFCWYQTFNWPWDWKTKKGYSIMFFFWLLGFISIPYNTTVVQVLWFRPYVYYTERFKINIWFHLCMFSCLRWHNFPPLQIWYKSVQISI